MSTDVSRRHKAIHPWGKRHLDDDVWTLAIERSRIALRTFDHCFVAFSGGKDSTATLEAALVAAEQEGMLPLRAVFWDEEAIPYETEDYVRRRFDDPRVAGEWYCLPVHQNNACSKEDPHWWSWDPDCRDLWVRPLPPEAIVDLDGFIVYPRERRPNVPDSTGLMCPADKYGSTGMLMGIRAQESLTRRRAVANRRAENWMIQCSQQQGPNVTKVYPVYDWSTEDVWTAPAKFGWDYNRAYDLMEMAGLSHNAQRCAPPYANEPIRALWVFKECFPDVWEPMSHRVPGAATAVRYATTELYSYGANRIEKPAEVSWEAWIERRIGMHDDPKMRQFAAYRIRRYIRSHYSKTHEPILDVPHPESGISWPWLFTIADRVDVKQRRNPTLVAPREPYQRALDEHNAEQRKVL